MGQRNKGGLHRGPLKKEDKLTKHRFKGDLAGKYTLILSRTEEGQPPSPEEVAVIRQELNISLPRAWGLKEGKRTKQKKESKKNQKA
jgi:hypothetical protein